MIDFIAVLAYALTIDYVILSKEHFETAGIRVKLEKHEKSCKFLIYYKQFITYFTLFVS